jgi:hypothetical protein
MRRMVYQGVLSSISMSLRFQFAQSSLGALSRRPVRPSDMSDARKTASWAGTWIGVPPAPVSRSLMHERTDLDIAYVRSIGLRTDLKIVLLTIPAVLGLRKGF